MKARHNGEKRSALVHIIHLALVLPQQKKSSHVTYTWKQTGDILNGFVSTSFFLFVKVIA